MIFRTGRVRRYGCGSDGGRDILDLHPQHEVRMSRGEIEALHLPASGGAAHAAAWLRAVRRTALRRDARVVFTAAVLVLALHTLMDLVLAREPGVSIAEHWVPLTASLALLALAAAGYGIIPRGGRGLLALVLGALSLEGAALAVADARAVGARGDDWTGFVLAPVGLLLLALGVWLLWGSRKPHGRRYVRRALLALAAVVGLYWVLLPIGFALMATHRPREAVASSELARPSQPVTVRTSDGLALRGRYVPSLNGAAVIVFPGSASRAPQARVLARHGYGVLMLDMRGYGASDGDPNMFGWGATKDIDAGVGFLRARHDVREGRVGGLGFSVGGELMLEAAAGNAGLRAVVADGAGERSVRESALRGVEGALALPAAAVQTAAVTVLSGELPPPSLVDLVPRISPRALLLVGAGRDNGGEDLQPHYYAAAKAPKAFWTIPEAGHTGGFAARPREYARRLIAFFDAALLRDAR
ncbi:MAG TPA: CocE/NonD family hydrolase [Gaiellaceae bacterium]|nr:CocE/NonD family hydrolase [Gaiellaceae bacterium]